MTERRIRLATLVPVALLLVAGCSAGSSGRSSSPSGSPDASLRSAGITVLHRITAYRSAAAACTKKPGPVGCTEAADRVLGGQVHTYANVLAVRHGFRAPAVSLIVTRNDAQSLADSLDVLGDAQPSQANYDQVRSTYDLPQAIDQFQLAVSRIDRRLES